MKQICKTSGKEFEITKDDLAFYQKIGVPSPNLCPEERQRRRQAFINLWELYSREDSSKTKKIISPFSADKDLNVVPYNIWISDQTDPAKFGRDYDFAKGFFEQFKPLQKVSPRWDRVVYNSENSHWALNTANAKNTYLTVGCNEVEDVYYSEDINTSSDVCDSFFFR